MRQTRFIRMKTTSEEPSTSNRRIKIRQGQSSRGKSDREDSSTRMSDQLHRRIRTARHRNGEYIANDSGTLTRRVSNHHVKKLSWLMLSELEEGYRYIPQLGDEVVYFRQVVYVIYIYIYFLYGLYYFIVCFGSQVSLIRILVYVFILILLVV